MSNIVRSTIHPSQESAMTESATLSLRQRAQAAFVPPTPGQLAAASDIVGRFAERWHRPRADDLRDLMHADTRNLIPPMKEPADREGAVEHFRQVLRQLPDLRIEVERWAPTGDAVMVEWKASATVAGQPLAWRGVDRFNVLGDRMIEAMVYWDTRGLAERIAATLAAATPSA
jgi:predicted SnoaL-like aldol condensation-catalyzing enzyme